jgi:hypothetical protein
MPHKGSNISSAVNGDIGSNTFHNFNVNVLSGCSVFSAAVSTGASTYEAHGEGVRTSLESLGAVMTTSSPVTRGKIKSTLLPVYN